ncbi:Chromosome partition protein Smc [Carpediemonas membranifera]|uniref:Chromosome partition protein Smc n=1 Tax=Carpediemonas membranifera TaxID=201153 RepID=A0A8J6AQX2_9EUKA|nr:Chromosome partition protein Smc [Carpediemonas membranifera]|eukprot:KAG9391588.1 Chromosome partition protein Smc [Carpediemonas membranifera]
MDEFESPIRSTSMYEKENSDDVISAAHNIFNKYRSMLGADEESDPRLKDTPPRMPSHASTSSRTSENKPEALAIKKLSFSPVRQEPTTSSRPQPHTSPMSMDQHVSPLRSAIRDTLDAAQSSKSRVRSPSRSAVQETIRAASVEVKANMYSEAYIERLQEQHRERVDQLMLRVREAREAQTKAEAALRDRSQGQEEEYGRREMGIASALEEAHHEAERASERMKQDLAKMQETHEREIADLEKTHQQQIEAMNDKFASALREQREQAVEESQAAVVREQRSVQAARAEMTGLERQLREEMAAMKREYENQLEAIKQIAKQQGQKAAEARERECSSQLAHDTEITALKDTLGGVEAELRKLASQKEREVQQVRNDHTLSLQKLKQHYETRVRTAEQTAAGLTSRVKALESQLEAEKANHKGQLEAAARDISLLNGYFEQSQKQMDQRKRDLDQMERRYSRSIKERDVLMREREVLRGEVGRLREANDSLQATIDRESRDVYGL